MEQTNFLLNKVFLCLSCSLLVLQVSLHHNNPELKQKKLWNKINKRERKKENKPPRFEQSRRDHPQERGREGSDESKNSAL